MDKSTAIRSATLQRALQEFFRDALPATLDAGVPGILKDGSSIDRLVDWKIAAPILKPALQHLFNIVDANTDPSVLTELTRDAPTQPVFAAVAGARLRNLEIRFEIRFEGRQDATPATIGVGTVVSLDSDGKLWGFFENRIVPGHRDGALYEPDEEAFVYQRSGNITPMAVKKAVMAIVYKHTSPCFSPVPTEHPHVTRRLLDERVYLGGWVESDQASRKSVAIGVCGAQGTQQLIRHLSGAAARSMTAIDVDRTLARESVDSFAGAVDYEVAQSLLCSLGNAWTATVFAERDPMTIDAVRKYFTSRSVATPSPQMAAVFDLH